MILRTGELKGKWSGDVARKQQIASSPEQVSLLTLIRPRPSRVARRIPPPPRTRPRPRRRNLKDGAPAKCGTRNTECRMPGGDRSHVAHRPAPDAHPPARDLILRVWHVYPLRCPVCQNPPCALSPSLKPREWWSESYATWASGTIHRPDRPRTACRGFSRVGREGDFGGRTGNRK